MRILGTMIMAGLALFLASNVWADEQPVDSYLKGDMAGVQALETPLDVSRYPLVTGFDGNKRTVETFAAKKGKVLLVTFWDRGCHRCRRYLKELDSLQRDLGENGFEVVAINTAGDSFANMEKTFERWDITSLAVYGEHVPSLLAELRANPQFHFYGKEPKSLLVGANGIVQAYTSVTPDWNSDDGKALIKALKGEAP